MSDAAHGLVPLYDDDLPEPECTCTQIDVDVFDAGPCQYHNLDSPWNHERSTTMEKVTFPLNQPQEIRLLYAEGKPVTGQYGPQTYYTLTDGRCMYLSTPVALAIAQLHLQPQEPFFICKKWNGQKGSKAEWHVYRQELPERKQPEPAQLAFPGEPEVRGTGTYGPVAVPRPVSVPRLVPAAATPQKVPYNVAFQEILQFVTEGLKAAGEQWNDEARQGLISTVLIQAAHDGYLTMWERKAA